MWGLMCVTNQRGDGWRNWGAGRRGWKKGKRQDEGDDWMSERGGKKEKISKLETERGQRKEERWQEMREEEKMDGAEKVVKQENRKEDGGRKQTASVFYFPAFLGGSDWFWWTARTWETATSQRAKCCSMLAAAADYCLDCLLRISLDRRNIELR